MLFRRPSVAAERSPELEEALGPGSPIVVFDKVSLAFDDTVVRGGNVPLDVLARNVDEYVRTTL